MGTREAETVFGGLGEEKALQKGEGRASELIGKGRRLMLGHTLRD